MPTSWSDDFTHDYFSDSTYTVIAGVNGVDFSVSGGLDILTSSTIVWLDERAAHTLPYQTAITFASGPVINTLVLGMTDASVSTTICAAIYTGGNVSILTLDTIDGELIGGTVAWTPPVPFTLGLNATSSTITVTELIGNTVLTSISTPPNLAAAIIATPTYPFVEIQH